MRFAAGLHPDPLGNFSASPDPLAATAERVLLLRGREGREGKEEEKRGEGRGKGRERERRGR